MQLLMNVYTKYFRVSSESILALRLAWRLVLLSICMSNLSLLISYGKEVSKFCQILIIEALNHYKDQQLPLIL
jgi:hypothetical protein